MAATTLLSAGETIGGFRVEDVIGIGGMAIVYRVEQVSLGRPAALKVLSTKLTSDPLFRERFRREGTHAAALEHPNIVPVYDSGEQDGHLYLAMRLVEGTNLAELIQTRGLTADQTIEILRPIASALDTAHAAGLIHRDVKPQNILITAQGHPYLADFGVAKGSNTQGLTATGGFVGSVNYACPEQIKGLTLTPASDVYALTAVLYQCLTGHVPYPRETDAGIMHAHLTEPPPTLPSMTGADSDFHSVLARGMAKDPGARYGHAGDLINAAALSVGRMPSKRRRAIPAFSLTEADQPSPTPVVPAVGRTELVEPDALAAIRSAAAFTAADQRRPAAVPIEIELPPRKRPIRLLSAILGTLLVLAVALTLLLGGSSNASTTRLRSGDLLITLSSRLHRDSSTAVGLALSEPISRSDGVTQLEAGSLLALSAPIAAAPSSLAKQYGHPAQASVTTLALGPVKRYLWPGTKRAPALLVAIVVTDAGESAIACRAPSTALAEMLATCERALADAQIVGTTVSYPGPDTKLAQQISDALRPLVSRDAGAPDLGPLPTRSAAFRQIAGKDESADAQLAKIAAPERYRAPLTGLIRAIAGEAGYARQLVAAAARGNRRLYAAERSGAAKVNGSLTAAAAALLNLGLTLPTIPPLRVPALPSLPVHHVTNPSPGGSHPAVSPAPTFVSPAIGSSPPPTYTAPRPRSRRPEIISE